LYSENCEKLNLEEMEKLCELRKRVKAQAEACRVKQLALQSQCDNEFQVACNDLLLQRRRVDQELEDIRVRTEVVRINQQNAIMKEYPDCDLMDVLDVIQHLASKQTAVFLPLAFVEMLQNQETDFEEWQAVNDFLSSRVEIVDAKADFWFRGRVEGYKGSETRFEYDDDHLPELPMAEFWPAADWSEYEKYDPKEATIVWPDSTDAGWAQAVITRDVIVLALRK
jgi:hypothetical protein